MSFLASFVAVAVALAPQDPSRAATSGWHEFVVAHCIDCHGGDVVKGGLDLDAVPADDVERLWRASRLRQRVLAGEMPPADAERPAAAEVRAFVAAVDAQLRTEVPLLPRTAGRVTVRRLSRSQWQNSVRDLLGVSIDVGHFPADDLGYGFDTIGDALSLSTLHLEHYLAAAGRVAALAIDDTDPARPAVRRIEAEAMTVARGQEVSRGGGLTLITTGRLEHAVQVPRDGDYRLRVLAGADQAGTEPARMRVLLGDRALATFDVAERRLREFVCDVRLTAGEQTLGVAFLNDHYEPQHPDPARRDRNLHVDWVELVGPTDVVPVPPARRWLAPAMAPDAPAAEVVRRFVRTLLPRLWRRPVDGDEIDRLAALGERQLQAGEPLAGALRVALQAALASPHFLFRIEVGGLAPAPDRPAPLPAHVIAQRLAFFLWGSAPDERLLALADKGRFTDPAALVAEVDRMLADARAESLATDFAAQWLELRNLAERTPDPQRFPGFDDRLRASLRRETELLFLAVLREGRDVRDLLDCDFTHVDATLAAFYGLPAEGLGDAFVKIALPPDQAERGGVLGHGSVLAVTSNPTRTSPVKRGKWILENLLGQPPPAPPPGNDSFADEAAIDSSRSFREQLAQHRAKASCAACHVRMDTLGFALERYDAIGRHRLRDAGGAIDASGQLPDGRRIDGLGELRSVLRDDPAFVRTLAHKLFVYGVGREARPIDRLRLDLAVEDRLRRGPVTLRDLVLLIVTGEWFTHRDDTAIRSK